MFDQLRAGVTAGVKAGVNAGSGLVEAGAGVVNVVAEVAGVETVSVGVEAELRQERQDDFLIRLDASSAGPKSVSHDLTEVASGSAGITKWLSSGVAGMSAGVTAGVKAGVNAGSGLVEAGAGVVNVVAEVAGVETIELESPVTEAEEAEAVVTPAETIESKAVLKLQQKLDALQDYMDKSEATSGESMRHLEEEKAQALKKSKKLEVKCLALQSQLETALLQQVDQKEASVEQEFAGTSADSAAAVQAAVDSERARAADELDVLLKEERSKQAQMLANLKSMQEDIMEAKEAKYQKALLELAAAQKKLEQQTTAKHEASSSDSVSITTPTGPEVQGEVSALTNRLYLAEQEQHLALQALAQQEAEAEAQRKKLHEEVQQQLQDSDAQLAKMRQKADGFKVQLEAKILELEHAQLEAQTVQQEAAAGRELPGNADQATAVEDERAAKGTERGVRTADAPVENVEEARKRYEAKLALMQKQMDYLKAEAAETAERHAEELFQKQKQVNDMEEYMKEFDMLMKQQFAASSNATTSSAQEAERATVELVDLQEKVVKLEEGISERDATVGTLLDSIKDKEKAMAAMGLQHQADLMRLEKEMQATQTRDNEQVQVEKAQARNRILELEAHNTELEELLVAKEAEYLTTLEATMMSKDREIKSAVDIAVTQNQAREKARYDEAVVAAVKTAVRAAKQEHTQMLEAEREKHQQNEQLLLQNRKAETGLGGTHREELSQRGQQLAQNARAALKKHRQNCVFLSEKCLQQECNAVRTSSGPISVTEDNIKLLMAVVRGPDWDKNEAHCADDDDSTTSLAVSAAGGTKVEQDGTQVGDGAGGCTGWAKVRWNGSRKEGFYRIGDNGKYEIAVAPASLGMLDESHGDRTRDSADAMPTTGPSITDLIRIPPEHLQRVCQIAGRPEGVQPASKEYDKLKMQLEVKDLLVESLRENLNQMAEVLEENTRLKKWAKTVANELGDGAGDKFGEWVEDLAAARQEGSLLEFVQQTVAPLSEGSHPPGSGSTATLQDGVGDNTSHNINTRDSPRGGNTPTAQSPLVANASSLGDVTNALALPQKQMKMELGDQLLIWVSKTVFGF